MCIRDSIHGADARKKKWTVDRIFLWISGRHVLWLCVCLLYTSPEISFKYIQNKQVKLHTSGNYNVKDVIYNIYGRDTVSYTHLDVYKRQPQN